MAKNKAAEAVSVKPPDSPPEGFGYTGRFSEVPIPQAAALQSAWDDLSDDEKRERMADCAHLHRGDPVYDALAKERER